MTASLRMTDSVPGHHKRTIILADVAGQCFGVRRAIDIAERARSDSAGTITTLGHLVHNSRVIERLRRAGVNESDNVELVSEGTVIISAHGAAPATARKARARGLAVLDATCPLVTKVHRAARKLVEQGYQVLIVGDRGHTEVEGVVGLIRELGGESCVVTSPGELYACTLQSRVGVICQTTQRTANFDQVVRAVRELVDEVRAVNTVCGATLELQAAAVRLAAMSDVVFVIGGRNSANTGRLLEICAAQGIPAYQVEGADDIEPAWIADKETIGVTAGASTPDWLIEEVVRAMNGGHLPCKWEPRHPDE